MVTFCHAGSYFAKLIHFTFISLALIHSFRLGISIDNYELYIVTLTFDPLQVMGRLEYVRL